MRVLRGLQVVYRYKALREKPNIPGAPFSKVPVVTGPEKPFSVCRVYIQDRDINSSEIQTIKISGNETEWTGF